MTQTARSVAVAAVALLSLPFVAAHCYRLSCEDSQTCATAGPDGAPGGDSGVLPVACRSLPSSDGSVIRDECGVFVSPEGNDEWSGSRATPLRSIALAMSRAKARQTRVYVCGGTYNESLVVDGALDGVQLLGGIDCGSGTYDATLKPLVKPSSGVALRITGVTASFLVEDVAFEAVDASEPGGSSVAGWVSKASGVVLRRVAFRAGAGAAGADGAAAAAAVSEPADRKGNDSSETSKACTCSLAGVAAGQSEGGGGGAMSAGAVNRNGRPGLPAYAPPDPATATGAGGDGASATCDAPVGSGRTGSRGRSGAAGTPVSSSGALSEATWQPTQGAAGAAGTVGQGGGGGAGSTVGRGGGGGCGGCPGGGGGGGQSGGSSFALVVLDSAVTLEASQLVTSGGGAGGRGQPGAAGQDGGFGGIQGTGACPGGAGGAGGSGGAGAGGGGGHSVALAWAGTAPIVDDGTRASAVVGVAGPGGAGGTTTNGGTPGRAEAVTELPKVP